MRKGGSRDFLRFIFSSMFKKHKESFPKDHVLEKQQALELLDKSNDYSITWLGHAAFLIKLNEYFIVTDPFLSKNAGPGFLGPKREIFSPLDLSELPKIDMLIISHNHYDHLDSKVIKNFPNKENIKVIVPLGLSSFFIKRGFKNVTEMNWWQEININNITIGCLPCVHFSGRGLFDRNKTLWASFSIKDKYKKIWFSGDTAYGDVFKEIGKKEKYFDLALIGIGAYEPRDFMCSVHATPEEAIQIAKDIKATKTIGMHWGTIRLTPEPFFEPPKRFKQAAINQKYGDDNALILKIGETINLEI
ncbi:MBL fold metallo-hydrolase [Francisella marina]|uniref:CMP-N-acetylneuraminate monooxygenase n=1 Tax=Francisella marina TaxID=2249302 RepID=A0ABX5ZKV8_9GAMM|nr:MBL fold metallo-hydrolase [Francisella marina]QEO57863.1 CMP-N-acetylneuraminate monooxygenase [Francisella marina]QEO59911.1 CMP-N-acetylneuraminate monooxygenase [Francisella marina]